MHNRCPVSLRKPRRSAFCAPVSVLIDMSLTRPTPESNMTDYAHYRGLKHLYANTPISRWSGSTALIVKGHAEVSMPVRPEFLQAVHAIHPSIYHRALNDAALLAVNSVVDDVQVLPVSFSMNLVRLRCDGEIQANGWIRHEQGALFVAESELRDTGGSLLATGNGVFCRSTIPLDNDQAYRDSIEPLPGHEDSAFWLSVNH
jgi:acyl-coenzyme A thioesterase PaaI-like protein